MISEATMKVMEGLKTFGKLEKLSDVQYKAMSYFFPFKVWLVYEEQLLFCGMNRIKTVPKCHTTPLH